MARTRGAAPPIDRRFYHQARHLRTGADARILHLLTRCVRRGWRRVHPSQAWIAAETGLNVRTVRRVCERLEGAGVLAVTRYRPERQPDGTYRRRTNAYRLCWPPSRRKNAPSVAFAQVTPSGHLCPQDLPSPKGRGPTPSQGGPDPPPAPPLAPAAHVDTGEIPSWFRQRFARQLAGE